MAVDAAATTFASNRGPGRERILLIARQQFKLSESIRHASQDFGERDLDILPEIDGTHTACGGQPRLERKRRFARAGRVMEG